MTTNARDEKWSRWIKWNGGERPLSEGVTHQVRLRDGDILDDDRSETWGWSHHGNEGDIIAYRYKIKEPESMEVTEAEEEAWQAKERELSRSDGSTASYYRLPEGCTELQHLISHRNMNAQIGEIFRACYRYGLASHSDQMRDARKILFYAMAEVERREALGAKNG